MVLTTAQMLFAVAKHLLAVQHQAAKAAVAAKVPVTHATHATHVIHAATAK